MVLTLEQVKNKRTTVKATATRFKKQLEALNANVVTTAELEVRKEKFSRLWDQFDQAQGQVEALSLERVDTPEDQETLFAAFDIERTKFENEFHATMAQLINAIEHIKARNAVNTPPIIQETAAPHIAENKIKLPPMNIPTFSDSFDTWRSFRDSFRSLVHDNESLTKTQKFHHLRSALTGSAIDVLHSIEVCDDNYDEAWKLLIKRFNNEKWIIEGHLNALLNLPPIKKETPEALRHLHDSVLKNLHALKSLKRPSDHWGDIVVQLILSKLDSNTFEMWELTPVSEEFPSLDEVLNFVIKQAKSRETLQKQFGSLRLDNSTKPSNLRVAKTHLATAKGTCPQCKGPHLPFECSSFREIPVNERLRLIQGAHLCTNCLRINKHNARNCPGSRCRKCGKMHHTLLHFERMIEPTKSSSTQPPANTPAIVGCLIHPSTVLLSTALIQVQRLDGTWTNCVALLDSGSQPNFITTNLADDLKLPVTPTNVAVKGISQDTVSARKCAIVRSKSR